MKLLIINVAHKNSDWLQKAENNYLQRLPNHYKLELVTLKPVTQGESEQRLAQEAALVIKHIPKQSIVVCLDEAGLPLTSTDFSKQLRIWHTQGSPVVLVIGSADGLAQTLKESAYALLSLSKMTLPHALARLTLIEQIYRAYTLETGHPYHRV